MIAGNVALTPISSNIKTGNIPVTYSTAEWCPDSCPLKPYIDATTGKRKSPCYAGNGHTAIHWNKVTAGERGGSWNDLCTNVRRLPKGGIWRHNVAGDLPVKI